MDEPPKADSLDQLSELCFMLLCAQKQPHEDTCSGEPVDGGRKTAITSSAVLTAVKMKRKGPLPLSPKDARRYATTALGAVVDGASSRIVSAGVKDALYKSPQQSFTEDYLESFLSRAVQTDQDTVVDVQTDGTVLKTAFFMPGYFVRLLSRMKDSNGLLIDVDYRHHSETSNLKGSYNASISLPDHSTFEFATMISKNNENGADSRRFLSLIDTALDGLSGEVGIMSDDAFSFIADSYPDCEWRLCAFHVKKNLAKHGHGSDREEM